MKTKVTRIKRINENIVIIYRDNKRAHRTYMLNGESSKRRLEQLIGKLIIEKAVHVPQWARGNKFDLFVVKNIQEA